MTGAQFKKFKIIKILLYDYRMPYLKVVQSEEIQFVYPNPKGSKLIFFTPFRDGVNEEN
jgi:hypothetical protein